MQETSAALPQGWRLSKYTIAALGDGSPTRARAVAAVPGGVPMARGHWRTGVHCADWKSRELGCVIFFSAAGSGWGSGRACRHQAHTGSKLQRTPTQKLTTPLDRDLFPPVASPNALSHTCIPPASASLLSPASIASTICLPSSLVAVTHYGT